MKIDLFNKGPIKLALIATYPEMSKIFIAMAREHDVEVEDIYASFDDAVVAAKEVEHRVDGIVSRGGTSAMIRENLSTIPVVSIPVTPFDLYLSLLNLPSRPKQVAFSNYARKIYGVRDIERSLGLTVTEYTFQTKADIYRAIQDAKNNGIELFIGGGVAATEAKKAGMTGVEINSGEESIYRSLQEMLELVRVQRQEKFQTERMRMLMNEMSEGIIMTDENQCVVLTNPAASRMLHKDADALMGHPLDAVLADEICYRKAAIEKKSVRDYVKSLGKTTLAINHFPVSYDNQLVGVVSTFEDVTKIQELENNIRKKLYAKGFVAKHSFNDIFTVNPLMESVIRITKAYAQTDSTIMIEGESGTGKELFAQSIHNASNWKNGPFVAVNCSAIPENLLESELFGYEPGAFTGANREGKPGLFELAHNGTLFLDEITEMPLHLQPRLLRIIQERQLMRLGGNKAVSVNVRIISATNKNVKALVGHSLFRDDLYYRLAVFEIRIPPLRMRREDIIPCLKSFLPDSVLRQPSTSRLLEQIEPALLSHPWPGNVRELQSVAERISLFGEGFLRPDENNLLFQNILAPSYPASEDPAAGIGLDKGLRAAVADVEKELIRRALQQFRGDQEKAAKYLRIGKTTLWRKLSDHPSGPDDKDE